MFDVRVQFIVSNKENEKCKNSSVAYSNMAVLVYAIVYLVSEYFFSFVFDYTFDLLFITVKLTQMGN